MFPLKRQKNFWAAHCSAEPFVYWEGRHQFSNLFFCFLEQIDKNWGSSFLQQISPSHMHQSLGTRPSSPLAGTAFWFLQLSCLRDLVVERKNSRVFLRTAAATVTSTPAPNNSVRFPTRRHLAVIPTLVCKKSALFLTHWHLVAFIYPIGRFRRPQVFVP